MRRCGRGLRLWWICCGDFSIEVGRLVLLPRRTSDRHQTLSRRNLCQSPALLMDKGSRQDHRGRHERAPSVKFDPTGSPVGAAASGLICRSCSLWRKGPEVGSSGRQPHQAGGDQRGERDAGTADRLILGWRRVSPRGRAFKFERNGVSKERGDRISRTTIRCGG
jgi:hypothetical protein